MNISNEEFDRYLEEAFDNLPEHFKEKLYNVAIMVDDYPTKEQLGKTKLLKDDLLYGLFEGVGQSARINFGVVLPDRITIFRKSIMRNHNTLEDIKKQIDSTLRHEISHHFGSDEKGARSAGKIIKR